MKQGVYIFAVCLMIHIRSEAATTLETVWLKDTSPKFLTEKRTPINTDFPNELSFHLTRRSETINLNLRRNQDINPNPDFYFARKLENGQLVLVKSRNTEKEDVAYYQDIKNGAFMSVRCVKRSKEQCDRIVSGNVRIGDIDYELQPAKHNVEARNLLEGQDILGLQYVLRDQTHNEREYSAEKKDAAQENEKNIEQKHTALLQRFQEQHKQKLRSPSITFLSSRNASTLHNRENTDKSRQLPEVYHVKVAVLIDPALFEFYHSTVHSTTFFTRKRDAIAKIKQFYSHIMNGVNMLYKGIEDTRIYITIILSDFIIFEKKDDFPYHKSRVVHHNGTDHIDLMPYLIDIKEWDEKTDLIKKKTFSHGMLFTRYKLYFNDLNDTECNGGTFKGEVCTVGERMSVIEKSSYVQLVYTAAHELGHSLGASHDGEGAASACKAEDGFIMTPVVLTEYPGKPYSKNLWLFSKCSVNSFKVTLKNKTCVRKHGLYYDPEYHKHVKSEPGDVFKVKEQCELIVGRGSDLCETAPEDICLLMRCRDPKTGICIKTYHGAARGTKCGRDKWCMDGLCVPKR